MSRYIKDTDIEEQYQSLKVQKYGDVNATISKEEILNLTLMAIDSCPTSDVVEASKVRAVLRKVLCDKTHEYQTATNAITYNQAIESIVDDLIFMIKRYDTDGISRRFGGVKEE